MIMKTMTVKLKSINFYIKLDYIKIMLYNLCNISKEIPLETLSDSNLQQICDTIQNLSVTIEKARDFEFAQVCTGGIPVHEIHMDTLESAIIPNLYFAGEILDVDGICGGYNLQWAWATGFIAGRSAAKGNKL